MQQQQQEQQQKCQIQGHQQQPIEYLCAQRDCEIENKLMCNFCLLRPHSYEDENGASQGHKLFPIQNIIMQYPEKLQKYLQLNSQKMSQNKMEQIQQFQSKQIQQCESQISQIFQVYEENISQIKNCLQDYEMKVNEFKQHIIETQSYKINNVINLCQNFKENFPQNIDFQMLNDKNIQKQILKVFSNQNVSIQDEEIVKKFQDVLQEFQQNHQSIQEELEYMQGQMGDEIVGIINEKNYDDTNNKQNLSIKQQQQKFIQENLKEEIFDQNQNLQQQEQQVQNNQQLQQQQSYQQQQNRQYLNNQQPSQEQQLIQQQYEQQQIQQQQEEQQQQQQEGIKDVEYYLNMSDQKLKKEFNKICEQFLGDDNNIDQNSKPKHHLTSIEDLKTEGCYICHQRLVLLHLIEELGPVYQIGLQVGKKSKKINVHYACIMFTNGILLDKYNKITRTQVLQKYRKNDCKICGKNMATMKCGAKKCLDYFHYACALKDFKDDSQGGSQGSQDSSSSGSDSSQGQDEEDSDVERINNLKQEHLQKEICYLDNVSYIIFCSDHRDQAIIYLNDNLEERGSINNNQQNNSYSNEDGTISVQIEGENLSLNNGNGEDLEEEDSDIEQQDGILYQQQQQQQQQQGVKDRQEEIVIQEDSQDRIQPEQITYFLSDQDDYQPQNQQEKQNQFNKYSQEEQQQGQEKLNGGINSQPYENSLSNSPVFQRNYLQPGDVYEELKYEPMITKKRKTNQ